MRLWILGFFVKTCFLLLSISIYLAGINYSYAIGNLMVTPTRIEFKEGSKIQEIKLVNRDSQATTYNISFKHLRMNEKGIYEQITETNKGKEKFADDLIIFSPKKATLRAGETQIIKLVLKKPDLIEDGEYRSHISFQEEPLEDINVINKKPSISKGIVANLTPLFNVSIPVIVQIGKVSSVVDIKDAKFNKNDNYISAKLVRSGNASIYGDLIAVLSVGGKKYEVGSLSNVSVFYPYENREVLVRLVLPKNLKLYNNANFELVYYRKKDGGLTDKTKTIASSKKINIEE